MMQRLVALALLLGGCSSGGTANPDLTMSSASDLAVTKDLASPGSSCVKPADCRLYSNNCDGCQCQPLRSDEVDPVCNGTLVSCFVDPCQGKSADCSAGHCVAR